MPWRSARGIQTLKSLQLFSKQNFLVPLLLQWHVLRIYQSPLCEVGSKNFRRFRPFTEINLGEKKATHGDKTPTLTTALKSFCEKARNLIPPLVITCESICIRAPWASWSWWICWLYWEGKAWTVSSKPEGATQVGKHSSSSDLPRCFYGVVHVWAIGIHRRTIITVYFTELTYCSDAV